jgi:hypothetical protein
MMMQRALVTLVVAFFLTIAFQTYQLIHDHSNLENAQAGQQAPLEQAVQMRQETEGLAGDIAALADKGNANAKQIVDGMRAQGIALRTPQAAAAPATVAPAGK